MGFDQGRRLRPTWKLVVVAAVMLSATIASTMPAQADTITGAGIVSGTRYRGGVPSAGGISYGVSIQVNKDATGAITKVRGVGRIT